MNLTRLRFLPPPPEFLRYIVQYVTFGRGVIIIVFLIEVFSACNCASTDSVTLNVLLFRQLITILYHPHPITNKQLPVTNQLQGMSLRYPHCVTSFIYTYLTVSISFKGKSFDNKQDCYLFQWDVCSKF